MYIAGHGVNSILQEFLWRKRTGCRESKLPPNALFTLKLRVTDLKLKWELILPGKKAVVISCFEVPHAIWWPYRQYLVKELSN
jgi:hypothetical protein